MSAQNAETENTVPIKNSSKKLNNVRVQNNSEVFRGQSKFKIKKKIN